MADYVSEELTLLRGVVKNPYDRAGLSAYADWLIEHGRDGEAAGVRAHSEALAPTVNGNSISVGELIGHLLTFPLDAPVIYRACSDWSELERDEVTLHKAEQQEICWREQNGYMDYNPAWFSADRAGQARRMEQRFDLTPGGSRYGPAEGEQPHFVTVVCLPGN